MILHTLSLSGWRCFARQFTLGPLGPGLNIIHGPNGTGKSTLLEALSRGVLDAHGVRGRQVEAMVPWGRDLSPTVVLEFSHGGARYRVEKVFWQGARVRLEIEAEGRFEPLAEGRAADARLREMFTRNPPARGPARFEHRGGAQVLWAAQSESRLQALSVDLVADLRGVLDAQLQDPLTQAIVERVAADYGRYFTAGGRPRRGQGAPEIEQWKQELQALEAELIPAEADLARHSDLSDRIQALAERRGKHIDHQERLKRQREQLEKEAARYGELAARLDRQRSRAREAEALHRQLRQQQSVLQTTARELQESETILKGLEDDLQTRRNALERLDSDHQHWQRQAQKVARMADEAVALGRQAESARHYLALRRQADRLSNQISRLCKIEVELQGLVRGRLSRPGPDGATLSRVRQLGIRRSELEGRLAAQGVTLELTAEQALPLEVAAGERAGAGEVRPELSPGESVMLRGTPVVAARIPGIVRIKVKGAGEDWPGLQAELERATADLSALLTPFGARRAEELEALAARDRELAEQETRLRAEQRTLLEGRPPEALAADLEKTDRRLKALAEAHPQWAEKAPDGEALERKALRQQAQVEARRSEIGTAAAQARLAWEKARDALHQLKGRRGEARRTRDRLAAKQAELKTQIDPQVLDRQIHQRLMAWEAAHQACRTLENQLAALGADPSPQVARLVRDLAGAEGQIQALRDEAQAAQGELNALSSRAPYSRVRDLKERAQELRFKIARQAREREALQLLQETLAECQRAATADLTLPVARRAVALLQRIDPERWGDLRLGDDFTPAAVRPARVKEAVEPTELSGGEQEQLHLAVRVALAEVLAREEPELLVLDDPLPATDPERLQRVKALLQETARHLQVLILTCHPQRYEDLSESAGFDLVHLKAQAEARGRPPPGRSAVAGQLEAKG